MQGLSTETLRNSIIEFGEELEISQLPQDNISDKIDFRIRIYTEDPTIIFDTCAQFGKIKSVKVNEG